MAESGTLCAYCLNGVSEPVWNSKRGEWVVPGLHYDHVIPRVHGGKITVPCCSICNLIKSDRVFGSWEEARAFIARRRRAKGYPSLDFHGSAPTHGVVSPDLDDELETDDGIPSIPEPNVDRQCSWCRNDFKALDRRFRYCSTRCSIRGSNDKKRLASNRKNRERRREARERRKRRLNS